MRPISAWARYMVSTVQVAERTGLDGYGKPTYSTSPASYKAHLTQGERAVRRADGQDVASNVTAHLAIPALILPTSQVTLSTGDAGSTESYMVHPVIAAVEQRRDQGGLHHTVLYLNWAPKSI